MIIDTTFLLEISKDNNKCKETLFQIVVSNQTTKKNYKFLSQRNESPQPPYNNDNSHAKN